MFEDVGLEETDDVTELKFKVDDEGTFEDDELDIVLEVVEEEIVEDEELDVKLELADSENVLAATFVLDVKVTPTGSSTAVFPFGSSATSWA